MAAQEMVTANERGAGPVVEALVMAAVWLLGLQAWRAAMFWLDGPAAGAWLPLAAAAVVVPGRLLGRWLGARRAAAWLLLVLVVVRAGVQLAGPALVLVYAVAGSLLFVAAADLQAMAGRPQVSLHGLLLGLVLVLTDRLLTGGYDLYWQGGGRAVTLTLLLLAPLLVLAMLGGFGPAGDRPRPTPLTLFIPLAVPLVAQGLAAPPVVLARIEAPWPRAGLTLAAAGVVALALAPLAQYFHAIALDKRALRRAGFQIYLSAVVGIAAVVGGGLLWPPLLRSAVLLGPLWLGLTIIAPAAARPIGRVRRASGWAAAAAWALAAGLSPLALALPGCLVIPVAGLAGIAWLAQSHPDRVAPPRPAIWPLACAAPLLVLAFAGALSPAVPRGGMPRELADHGLRLATVDLAPDGRLAPARLARQGRELRTLGVRMVLVRPAPDSPAVGWDAAVWLARRLRLHCYRLAGPGPALALLAPAPPETLTAPADGTLAATWRLGPDETLGLAFVDSLPAAAAWGQIAPALETCQRRLVIGQLPPGRPPAGYLPGRHLATRDHASADRIWAAPGIQTLDVPPVVPVREINTTALLLITPPSTPAR